MGCVPRGSKENVHRPLGMRAPLVKQSEPHTAILVRPAGQGLGGVQSARTSQGQEGTWEAQAAMPWGSLPRDGSGGWKEQTATILPALRSSTCWSYCGNGMCMCVWYVYVCLWGVGVPSTFGWGWRGLRRVAVVQGEAWFNLGGALGVLGVGDTSGNPAQAGPPKPQVSGSAWKFQWNPILPNFADFSPEVGNQSRSNRQDHGSLLDALGHSQMLSRVSSTQICYTRGGAGLAHYPRSSPGAWGPSPRDKNGEVVLLELPWHGGSPGAA